MSGKLSLFKATTISLQTELRVLYPQVVRSMMAAQFRTITKDRPFQPTRTDQELALNDYNYYQEYTT